MERGLVMVSHSVVIAIILYICLVYLFNFKPMVAENKSILISAIVLIYMLVFGHKLPF
jgi:hypothetical protein